MKKYILFFLIAFSVLSCKKKNDKVQEKAEEIPLTITVHRYDKIFFQTAPKDFDLLKAKYPEFFPPGIDEAELRGRLTNPLWLQLYEEVEKRYGDFDKEKAQLESVFKYMKYYYPKFISPKVFTVINNMDTNAKVLYNSQKNGMTISLEMYLGKNHKFYEFPNYVKQTFEPSQMMPDVVESLSYDAIKLPTDREFLSQIIYIGKQLYFKDIMLPEFSDEDKICYTPDQLKWCEDNDVEVWHYFMEERILYNTNPKMIERFLAPAPFSKFGLDNDSDTPGRIGAWIGWQIVRSFMENNSVSPQQMFMMDGKEIFQKSKYKPVKD
ncbi:MAG: gliding motility lipoprotein GldB [Limnohabitans sp.]|nr:gliding motility lipoprotein GldB [Limnohabitans sp.]